MDVDALIDAVHKRKPIWDRQMKLHSSRDLIDALWKEISDELDCEGMESCFRLKTKIIIKRFGQNEVIFERLFSFLTEKGEIRLHKHV